MTHFGNGERKQGTGWRRSLLAGRLGGGYPSLGTDTCKACLGQHHQRDVTIPSREASDFVILQAHFFPCFKTFFNFPSRSDRLDHLGKRGAHWGKDEVIGFLLLIVKAATDEQKVLPILFPPVQHGHDCPIELPWPFGSVTHRESLPILGVKRERLGLGHRHAFATLWSLYPH